MYQLKLSPVEGMVPDVLKLSEYLIGYSDRYTRMFRSSQTQILLLGSLFVGAYGASSRIKLFDIYCTVYTAPRGRGRAPVRV